MRDQLLAYAAVHMAAFGPSLLPHSNLALSERSGHWDRIYEHAA
jgi:hypothetical protein